MRHAALRFTDDDARARGTSAGAACRRASADESEFNLGESEHDFRVPDGGRHRPGAAERSRLIELGPAELAERLDWP